MIIIYGGSFNPPTIAHYKIAQYLIAKYRPRKLYFVPVGEKYQKKELAPFKHRAEMLKILCQRLKNASVSDYENTDTYKGTYDTLNHFKDLYENEEIVYCIGADNLIGLEKWINYEMMLSNYRFIVFKRDRIDVVRTIDTNLGKFSKQFIIEDYAEINVSASKYRKEFNEDVVLEEVNEYIYRHQLYDRGGL